MIKTIISNNCTGAAVMHHMGVEFRTTTINLQILPEEFPKFCKYLKAYLQQPLVEYKAFSDRHIRSMEKMFGGVPGMPFGLCGDILVCFQHYDTFEEAAAKWNERKARVNLDEVGYLFHARGPEYKDEIEQFVRLGLPNALAIAEGFDADGAVRFNPPEGGNAFSALNGEVAIVTAYDWKEWMR